MIVTRNQVLKAGFDVGNGTLVADIAGKTSVMIAGYASQDPGQAYHKGGRGSIADSKVFPLNIGEGESFWFGNGLLTDGLIRRFDVGKYDPLYLRRVLSGIIAKWIIDNKVQIDHTLRLDCGFGIAPGLFYDDKQARKTAEKAFKEALKHTGKNQWFMTVKGQRVNVIPQYKGLYSEAVSVGLSEQLAPGYTVIIDGGLGTLDVAVFHSNFADRPVMYQTEFESLGVAFDNATSLQVDNIEAGILAGQVSLSVLQSYNEKLIKRLLAFNRTLTQKDSRVKYQFVGGICNLLDPESMAYIKASKLNVVFKGIEANATAFRKLVERGKG